MPAGKRPVAIVMGSQSDWETLRFAAAALDELGIGHESLIVSAHRTPDRLFKFAKSARKKGFKVVIAGAGGAAHLPGMTASLTEPQFGVDKKNGQPTRGWPQSLRTPYACACVRTLS